MNKLKEIAKNLLFSLFVFLVFFGSLELCLRTFKQGFYYRYKSKDKLQFTFGIDYLAPHPKDTDHCPYQLDPFCYFRLKPNFHLNAWNYYGKVRWEIHTNNLGFRSRPVSIEKRRTTFRIACLGDSVTFGFNVDQEDTYPSVVENMLNYNLRERHIEVINAGVPGYASPQGVEMFTHYVLPLKPDLITVAFGRNDANYRQESPAEKLRSMKPFMKLIPVVNSFESYKLLRYLVLEAKKAIFSGKKKPAKSTDPKEYQEHILKIVDIARENDIGVILLNCDLISSYQSDFLKRLAKKRDFPFVNLTAFLRSQLINILEGKADYPELKFYRSVWGSKMIKKNPHLLLQWKGGHPNALGHWMMAQALTRAIKQESNFKAYTANRTDTKHFDDIPKPKDLTPP